jgi:uncharacterized ferredoxin-like protein
VTRITSSDAEHEAVRTVAYLMAAAARSAPKGRGVDAVRTLVIEGEDIATLATVMDEVAPGRPEIVTNAVRRDARNVRDSRFVVLMGVNGSPKKPENPFDCGACGFKTCANLIHAREKAAGDTDFAGPVCVFASLDLGVALGSAAKVASDHNIDNRLMYTMGLAAAKLKWLDDADLVIGIPLSVSGKSIFFDRG